jgi:hypothetical protein
MYIRFPLALDAIPRRIGEWLAAACGWSPLGEHVILCIDDCGDRRFKGKRMRGVIRAYGLDADVGPLLVQLQRPLLRYDGHFISKDPVEYVVLSVAVEAHTLNRLLVSWVAVRIIAAPSFCDATYDRTIGTGRVMLA